MLTATRFDVNVSILFPEHPLPERPSSRPMPGSMPSSVGGRLPRPRRLTLDLDGVLAALDAGGYPGYVGLENRPSGPTVDSFDWLPRDHPASPTGARRQPWGGTR